MEVTKWLKLFTGAGWGVVSVPASAAVEAAAANQKHDHDNDEKSGHIHDDVSFGQTSDQSLQPQRGMKLAGRVRADAPITCSKCRARRP